MRSMTRLIALGLVGIALTACAHKDKNAPLAFAPADTPYAVANLKGLDDDTRQALLAQADAQLPSQLSQLDAVAESMAGKDPDSARLLHAFAAEFKHGDIETFARNTGIDLKGRSALYGIGLAPVLRFELSDPKAFGGFISRLETAYGKKLDVASVGKQSYRRHQLATSGSEIIVAVIDKQAVIAMLPSTPPTPLLRQALGLDRPDQSLQDSKRLKKLAKAKGYRPWLVGDLDLARALPLLAGGKDPLFNAMLTAHARTQSAKTGEPVANQLKIAPSCAGEAARIAARVPSMSFGYTRLDAKHQDGRFDIALAPDITKAFAGLTVTLPGLGTASGTADTAPYDLSLALPVEPLRQFWSDQADAVSAKPFSCPTLTSINRRFAKLGPAMQQAAIPPFGDMLGVRLALDTLAPGKNTSLPTFTGRIVLATNNPVGLLAMGRMMVPSLARLKLGKDGQPMPLPKDLDKIIGLPGWIAMSDKALALGIGPGEGDKLAATLKQATGDPGRMARMHLSGGMYLSWLHLMEQKADTLAAATAALGKDDSPSIPGASPAESASQIAANAARSKAQLAAMKEQAKRIDSIDVEMHIDHGGMVITSRTLLK